MAKSTIPPAVRDAYRLHRSTAAKRGIPFHFSITEWWEWWGTENRWEKRGRGGLCMARYNDSGPYMPDNVYCATWQENIRDVPKETRKAAMQKAWSTRRAVGYQPPNLRYKYRSTH